MGEGEHVFVIAQVLEPLLYRCQHAHFVIEPGQLFGSCALQGIKIMQQQVMDRRDNKGFLDTKKSNVGGTGWLRFSEYRLFVAVVDEVIV